MVVDFVFSFSPSKTFQLTSEKEAVIDLEMVLQNLWEKLSIAKCLPFSQFSHKVASLSQIVDCVNHFLGLNSSIWSTMQILVYQWMMFGKDWFDANQVWPASRRWNNHCRVVADWSKSKKSFQNLCLIRVGIFCLVLWAVQVLWIQMPFSYKIYQFHKFVLPATTVRLVAPETSSS